MTKRIIPDIAQRIEAPEQFLLPETIKIDYGTFEHWSVDVFLKRTGRKVARKADKPFLVLKKDIAMIEEAYKIDMSNQGILIRAASERGVIWALTTIYHLLEKAGGQEDKLPWCCIEDAPKYSHRGLSFDCVREFWPVDEVKKIIEALSLVKINVLHWHLSDDQGFCIESKRFPELLQGNRYYKQEEVREIVQFAKVRGIEVIPEVDMPGHTTAILHQFPQYSCSGLPVEPVRGRGIFPRILCPGKDETFAFAEALLDEIIPLFESPRFHIGGDEAPKTEWEKCPHCKKRMKEEGIANLNDLQGYFTKRICAVVEKHGKTPICWNETLLSSCVPENLCVQYWTLQHKESMKSYIETGRPWIYSEMFDFYLDYPYSMTSLKRIYQTKIPWSGAGKTGGKAGNNGLIGLEACIWQEHIHDTRSLEEHLFPRVWAVAELAWSGKRSYKKFREAALEYTNRLQQSASISGPMAISSALGLRTESGKTPATICCQPLNAWDPWGPKRTREAVDFYFAMTSGMEAEVREDTVNDATLHPGFVYHFITRFLKPGALPRLLWRMLVGNKDENGSRRKE